METDEKPSHPITVHEYAKVRAVLERIEGLRRAMVATVAVGLFCAFLTWFVVLVNYASSFYNPTNPFYVSFLYAVVVFLPFLLVTGYFSYRVSKHVDRLSRGKYQAPRVVD